MDQRQTLINLSFGLIAAMAGAMGNVMWNSISDLRRADSEFITQISSVRLMISDSYVKRADLERMTSDIFTKLDKIESKIDRKADKRDGNP